MRMNIYSEEVTGECKLVRKTDERGREHVGVRAYLIPPISLYNTEDFPDRSSAVTFWLPPDNPGVLFNLFHQMAQLVHVANAQVATGQ